MTSDRLIEFASHHPVLVLALVGLTIAIVLNELSRFWRGYAALRPAELTRLLNQDEALLIDVSGANDFEKGHITGARHVAMSQFDPENKVLAKARDLPVAVVCRNGITSAGAAKRLSKAGFKRVYWLDGGVAAWQQADLPLVRGKH